MFFYNVQTVQLQFYYVKVKKNIFLRIKNMVFLQGITNLQVNILEKDYSIIRNHEKSKSLFTVQNVMYSKLLSKYWIKDKPAGWKENMDSLVQVE